MRSVLIIMLMTSFSFTHAVANDFLFTVESYTGELYGQDSYDIYSISDSDIDITGLEMIRDDGEKEQYSLEQLQAGVAFARLTPSKLIRTKEEIKVLKNFLIDIDLMIASNTFDDKKLCNGFFKIPKFKEAVKTQENCIKSINQVGMGEKVTVIKSISTLLQEIISAPILQKAPVLLKLIKIESDFSSGARYKFEVSSIDKSKKSKFYLQNFKGRWIPYSITENAYIGLNENQERIDEGALWVKDIISIHWIFGSNKVDSISSTSPLSQGHANLFNVASGGEEIVEAASIDIREKYHSRHSDVYDQKNRILKENGFPKLLERK